MSLKINEIRFSLFKLKLIIQKVGCPIDIPILISKMEKDTVLSCGWFAVIKALYRLTKVLYTNIYKINSFSDSPDSGIFLSIQIFATPMKNF